jgi:hypothetical protein
MTPLWGRGIQGRGLWPGSRDGLPPFPGHGRKMKTPDGSHTAVDVRKPVFMYSDVYYNLIRHLVIWRPMCLTQCNPLNSVYTTG